MSSPIHASVSGTVKGIEYRFNPAGTKTECIIIENDGEYAEINDLTVKPFGEMKEKRSLRESVKPVLSEWEAQVFLRG